MSVVENHMSSTSSSSLQTMTSSIPNSEISTTPMSFSSSPTITSLPLGPLFSLSPPSSSPSFSVTMSMSELTNPPSTGISTPPTIPTTTTSTTVTPTTTVTTTAFVSTRSTPTSTLTTIIPTSTVTTTVILPTSSVRATSNSPTTSATSHVSLNTPTSTTPIPATTIVISTPLTGTIAPSAEIIGSITPVSTFSTTVYVSTTDFRGSTTIYAPPYITSTMTFMDSGGMPTTSTAVIANPTLNVDDSSPSSFFQNKGAVAGVFTLVALAVISITFWVIFFIKRRRREMSLERDTAISTSLAAVFNRTPLVDESDSSLSSHRSRYGSGDLLAIPMPNPNTDRRRRGLPENNNGRLSILPDAYHEDRGSYDPFIEYATRNSRDNYHDLPSPTTPHLDVPPLSAFAPYRNPSDGPGMVELGTGMPMSPGIAYPRHSHQSSRGSLEPLLASHQRRPSGPFGPGLAVSNGRASQLPPRENGSSASTIKLSYLQTPPNFYATDSTSRSALLMNGGGQGSDVNLVDAETHKQDAGDVEVSTEEGHRRVLAVRNLPDAASTASLS